MKRLGKNEKNFEMNFASLYYTIKIYKKVEKDKKRNDPRPFLFYPIILS